MRDLLFHLNRLAWFVRYHAAVQALSPQIMRAIRRDPVLRGLLSPVTRDDELLVKADGVRTFWVSPGGFIDQSAMRTQTGVVPRDIIGFHLHEFEGALRKPGRLRALRLLAVGEVVRALHQRVGKVLGIVSPVDVRVPLPSKRALRRLGLAGMVAYGPPEALAKLPHGYFEQHVLATPDGDLFVIEPGSLHVVVFEPPTMIGRRANGDDWYRNVQGRLPVGLALATAPLRFATGSLPEPAIAEDMQASIHAPERG